MSARDSSDEDAERRSSLHPTHAQPVLRIFSRRMRVSVVVTQGWVGRSQPDGERVEARIEAERGWCRRMSVLQIVAAWVRRMKDWR